MRLVFVHGWSVTTTETYGQLPEALVAACANSDLQLDIQHIQLGKYVSFNDEVNLDDIARGLNQALLDLPDNHDQIQPFSCITHSTGGPVVRHWIDEFYGAANLDKLSLKHLIMLAPANHGSALAVLGKKRVSRISSWLKGVETGQRVLDWLSLGSLGQRKLNRNGLDYQYASNNVYPFVLTGQGIDRELYDFINSYLVEPGSDGVVRVAGANMNYRFFALEQTNELVRQDPATTRLVYDDDHSVRIAPSVPLGVITAAKGESQPVVADIVKCLQVDNKADYLQRGHELTELTENEQQRARAMRGTERYAMLIFHIHDDQGNHFSSDDYDILLLGGKDYQPFALPKGFFMDRQMNSSTSNLVYYINV
ncbi:MAG: phospholipase, partial [Deltaproteobacteria bacterium]|nr:phospholipase [Deltaproteobacteria bacterium]